MLFSYGVFTVFPERAVWLIFRKRACGVNGLWCGMAGSADDAELTADSVCKVCLSVCPVCGSAGCCMDHQQRHSLRLRPGSVERDLSGYEDVYLFRRLARKR